MGSLIKTIPSREDDMIKKMMIVLLALLPVFLSAEEGIKAGSITLYDSRNSQPFTVNSDGGWMDITPVYSEAFSRLQPALPGTLRKWRVRTSYIDESRSSGQSTLQVKLRPYDASAAVFYPSLDREGLTLAGEEQQLVHPLQRQRHDPGG